MTDGEIDYTTYFLDILRTAKEGSNIKMCLLKKTLSKKDEKKRDILNVEVDIEIPALLQENITKIYNNMIDNKELKCTDFFTGDKDKLEKKMFVINEDKMKAVGTLNPIISRIIKDDDSDSNSVTKFDSKTIDKLQSHAIFISFIRNENEVILNIAVYFLENIIKAQKYQKIRVYWRSLV